MNFRMASNIPIKTLQHNFIKYGLIKFLHLSVLAIAEFNLSNSFNYIPFNSFNRTTPFKNNKIEK